MARTRYVEFTQAIFDDICDRISKGKSLRFICSQPGMPDRKTFNTWRKSSPDLQAQYDEACLAREDHYFDEIIEIADECRKGVKTVTKKTKTTETTETTEVDMVERAKVQIDARKWVLACMNRKKYGNKLGVDGGEDGSPLVVEIVRHGDRSEDA